MEFMKANFASVSRSDTPRKGVYVVTVWNFVVSSPIHLHTRHHQSKNEKRTCAPGNIGQGRRCAKMVALLNDRPFFSLR